MERISTSNSIQGPDKIPTQQFALSPSILELQDATDRKGSSRRKSTTRIRVKLPVIESFEKEFEYTADAPGRVVVRLERLMGTDRIRITDQKYMNTLFRQLEFDEQKLWVKRSRQRKQREINRFRQLAIEGHMEPGPEMQDLYHHPVFRVNRILDRLSKLDNQISTNNTGVPLPPLTPVEPFEEYKKTGILFGFHSGHYRHTAPASSTYKISSEENEEEVVYSPPSAISTHAAETDNDFLRKYERESGMITTAGGGTESSIEDEWGGEDYQVIIGPDIVRPPEGGACNANSVLAVHGPLSEIERAFGIATEEKMEKTFTPHRSALVEKVYNEDTGGANDIYTVAKEVLDTYKREQMKAESVVNKLHRDRY